MLYFGIFSVVFDLPTYSTCLARKHQQCQLELCDVPQGTVLDTFNFLYCLIQPGLITRKFQIVYEEICAKKYNLSVE